MTPLYLPVPLPSPEPLPVPPPQDTRPSAFANPNPTPAIIAHTPPMPPMFTIEQFGTWMNDATYRNDLLNETHGKDTYIYVETYERLQEASLQATQVREEVESIRTAFNTAMETFQTLEQQITTALNHSQATERQTAQTLSNFRDSVPGPNLRHDTPEFFRACTAPADARAVD